MDEPVDPKIADAVSRFLKSRREGRRASLDQSIAEAGAAANSKPTAAKLLADAAKHHGPPSYHTRAGADPDDAPIPPTSIPDLPEIEGYDIIDIVGRGGMGVVYEAYQRSTGRRVAVKLMLDSLTGGVGGERTRRRFEREVELVARLSHPNIVSILDSGAHKGRHYYVMEYIEGVPLDDAIHPGETAPNQSLALIAKIADAVDYAHQRGVIHRDLKPGNILIDARGEPHLLDFGLAKSFDPNSLIGVRASLSEPGQFLGTPAYMPPEQARGETERMSVRSDVYSLGAIAYELLTGRLPCGMEGPLALILERINSIDASRPSSLRKGIDADIDAIVLKCLEKSPDRRYSGAGELAADIRRHLNDEPIHARRTSLAVRGMRWMKRHKLATTIVAASTVIVLGSAGFYSYLLYSTNQYYQAAEALDVKNTEEYGRLGNKQQPSDLSIPFLRGFSERAASMYQDRPLNEARVRLNIGKEFGRWASLGQQFALHEFERAVQLIEAHKGPDTAEAAEARHNMANALYSLGRFPEALENYTRAYQLRKDLLGEADLRTLETYGYLASTLVDLGRYTEAERIHRETLAGFRRVLRTNDPKLGSPMNNLARCLFETGKFDEAYQLLQTTLPLSESNPEKDPVFVARARNNMAVALVHLNRAGEALAYFDEAIRNKRAEYGKDTDDVAGSIHYRAEALAQLGRLDEALTACEESLAIRRRERGERHRDTAASLFLKARLLIELDRCPEAAPILDSVIEIRRAVVSPMHPSLSEAEAIKAECLAQTGNTTDAESLFRGAVENLLTTRGPEFPTTRRAVEALASLLKNTGRADEAKQLESTIAQKPPISIAK